MTKAGDYIYRIGIPLLLFQETGSALWAGVAFASQQVGAILAGALSGPVIDRRNPRSVMLLAVGTMAAITAVIPLLHSNSSSLLIGALVVGFLLEILNFTYRACLNSITPLLVQRDRLPDASAVMSVSKFVSKTAGPAIAGVVLATLGPSLGMLVDSASFILLFVIIIFVGTEGDIGIRAKVGHSPYIQDIKDGWRYIISDRSLVMLNVINFIANLGYVPLLSMFVIHLTDAVKLDSATIGTIYAVDGCAALISGLALPAVMRVAPTGRIVATGCLGLGLSISAFAVLRDPIAIGVSFFAAMACAQIVNRVIFTHWQMTVDPEYRARVFGISSALESLATPSVAIGAGIAAATSSSALFAISGLLAIFAGLVGLLSKSVRRLDPRVRENTINPKLGGE